VLADENMVCIFVGCLGRRKNIFSSVADENTFIFVDFIPSAVRPTNIYIFDGFLAIFDGF
jgi:hypothetical protein